MRWEVEVADRMHVSGRVYLLEGELAEIDARRVAAELLTDAAIEDYVLQPEVSAQTVTILPKPGVMDPVAESVQKAIGELGLPATHVRTGRRHFYTASITPAELKTMAGTELSNDVVEEAHVGPLPAKVWSASGSPYVFRRIQIPLRSMDDDALQRLSREGQLALNLVEMQTIREHYRRLGRDATDIELETIAQTWSEHCSHKTLKGRIEFTGPLGTVLYQNLLKQTIFEATQEIRRRLGKDDWCVSVFADNAGVVKYDHKHHVCFKVETHNHPSAIEPYGGANTGFGGVIRDVLGTGLGGKPICNTDVFCFAPPDCPKENLPPGVLHPRRVMHGVVSGVRDYGNRMGIPTVNGAICFDDRYLANPLVYCGTVGLIPAGMEHKSVRPGDLIVAVGGRTGRDGIHGATFSSIELTHESEAVSGGAVQIGNAITEKKLLDVLLQARDRHLYNAITDCGAGGYSSAIGEMGAELGAEVHLHRAPLKYAGLSYCEIWISEAQERMVLAVRPDKWPDLESLCAAEDIEATVLGEFKPTGQLTLFYDGQQVGELDMRFLHEGRPPVVRKAIWSEPIRNPESGVRSQSEHDYRAVLQQLLASPNIASKEWVIRQYDHEVQGGSVIKPLVGITNDGPSDASVILPDPSSVRGLAIGCGINPRYGDLDPYWMAASVIDEAVRNVVAVGADPSSVALLDNFCWGNTDRPETLGSLVRAAEACRDVALAYGTPYISGKDSLNNEFHTGDVHITIPPTLLISALGLVPEVRKCVTMDLKSAGNYLFLVGLTRNELGGSHFHLVTGRTGGAVPTVDLNAAPRVFKALHDAMRQSLVRACHDLSEGGLAVAAAEMAFAGGLGALITLDPVLMDAKPEEGRDVIALFSESNTRFLCEVTPEIAAEFSRLLAAEKVPHAQVGWVLDEPRLQVYDHEEPSRRCLIDAPLVELKEAWQAPLRRG